MTLPTLGDNVPQRGNAFSRWLGRSVLRLLGWRVEGELPNLPKMVLIGASHTSNVDALYTFATLIGLGLRASTMIKDTAFRAPLGGLLRWLGAIPVDRKRAGGVIGQSIAAFQSNSRLVLLLAPEGTRHATAEFKAGFHRVAKGAEVPIVPAAIDYPRRRIIFGEPLTATDDLAADTEILLAFYARHAHPRHPDRMSKPICQAKGIAWKGSPTK
jgi:1-acyl-sn-glycerol-3-phosphate acyltransferase